MNNINEILDKASECLNCKRPTCKNGCPISTNIPEFINAIKNNRFKEAYEILHENNVMSEICGKVCPYEEQCQSKCIKGIKGKSVEINALERFINEWAEENNIKYKYIKSNQRKEKIAVIGAGPAGIACATELLKKGYKVTIFEKESKAGGILEYGIPDFRLPKEIIHKVIKRIIDLGAKIEYNIEFGKDITLSDLKKKYKAIFLSIGANTPFSYELTNNECKNIYSSNDFLKNYNSGKNFNLGTVVVIGGRKCSIRLSKSSKKDEC